MSQNSSNQPSEVPVKDSEKSTAWRRIGLAAGLPLWVFLGFMLAQAAVIVVFQVLALAGLPESIMTSTGFTVTVSAFIYVLALAIVMGVPYLVKKRKTTLVELGVQRPPKWYEFLAAPAGTVVYFILSAILMYFAMTYLTFIDFEQVQDTGFNGVTAHFDVIMAFIALVIVAPVAEEVLFRGYLLGKLRKYVPVWVAILITSALFAAVHFQWNVAIDTFALSIVLCLLRITTGSLWPAIMLHMIKNGLAFYLLFINPTLLSTLGA